MKNPDEQPAEDLARFLTSRSPDDAARLDEDVVEALFAIRPDLAPAPRLTADDILGSVRRGPLAQPDVRSDTPLSMRSHEAAVVQFPGVEEDPSSESADATVATGGPHHDSEPDLDRHAERGSRWPFVGGTSGWGLLLAAAATLFIVSRPVIHEAAQEEPAPSRPALADEVATEDQDAPAEPIGERTGQRIAEREGSEKTGAAPSPPPPRTAPVPTREAKRELPADEVAEPVVAAADDVRTRSVGPARGAGSFSARGDDVPLAEAAPSEADEERVSPLTEDFIAELPAGRSYQTKAKESEAPADLDELRALARPTDVRPGAWRDGLTPARLAVIDETLAAAEAARKANDPILAGDLVSSLATRPPARAAQHLAAIAARDFLAGRSPGRAEAVARAALPLGLEATPERSQLLFVLGLALEAGGAEEAAAEAFRSAIEANRSR